MKLRLADDIGTDDEDDFLPIEYDDGRPAFALVLLGYRNDLSRHAVLALLRDRIEDGPPDPPLPYTIAARIDGVNGARLLGELEDAGAVVSFTPAPARIVGAAKSPPPVAEEAAPVEPRSTRHTVQPSLPTEGTRFALPPRHVRIAALVAFGAYCIFLQIQAQQERLLESAAVHVAPRIAPQSRLARAQPLVPATAQRVRRLIAAGRLEDAREVIEGSARPEDDALSIALRGEIEFAAGDWRRARTTLELARDLGNQDPEMFVALASIYRQQGDQRAAADMLQRAHQNGASGQAFEEMRRLIVRGDSDGADAKPLENPRVPATTGTIVDPPS